MMNWLSLIAGIGYLILGVLVIVYKFFLIPLEDTAAYPLGGLLVVYGLFRLYRAILKFKKRDEEV